MKLTIERAFAVSLVIHAAILLPVAMGMSGTDPDDDEMLVVDLKGLTADDQSEEKVTEQTAGSRASQAESAQNVQAAQAGEKRQSDESPAEAGPAVGAKPEKPAVTKATTGAPGSVNVRGSEQQQEAHRLRANDESRVDPLKAYVKALTKRVEAKLVYPITGKQAGLRGWPIATFTILQDGSLQADSLKILSSSGQLKFDESALETIRACAPFDPPPREITLKITVKYGR